MVLGGAVIARFKKISTELHMLEFLKPEASLNLRQINSCHDALSTGKPPTLSKAVQDAWCLSVVNSTVLSA